MGKYFIINTESFSRGVVPPELIKFRATQGKTVTILDESSFIKTSNPCRESKKSMRTQTIKKLSSWGENGILTGTFMSKSPLDIYDQIEFIKPNFFTEGMFAFSERYTIKMELSLTINEKFIKTRTVVSRKIWDRLHKEFQKAMKLGMLQDVFASAYEKYKINEEGLNRIATSEKYMPYKHLDELYKRIEPLIMIIKKTDVLDLPPKTYQVRKVQLTSEQKVLYKELLKLHMTSDCTVTNALTLYIRLQDVINGYNPIDGEEIINGKRTKVVRLEKLSSSAKIDETLQTLEEIDLDRFQVVVWACRSKLLKDLVEAISEKDIKAVRYDGKMSDADREESLKEFEAGKARVIVINQHAGSFGLDCLKKAAYAIYVCNDNSVIKRQQSEDRIHRGLFDGVSRTIIDIVAEGTIDEIVAKTLKLGEELVHSGTTDAEVFKLHTA